MLRLSGLTHSSCQKNLSQSPFLSRLFLLSICFSVILASCAPAPTFALSEQQTSAISQNCPTIKQSLTQLQKVDSKTRTYLGTTYETLVNKFITPLNLRLVKNNRPTLSSVQSKFTSEQTRFKDEYTTYMRELEELIAVDCQNNPQDFYKKLETVRKKRAELRETTVRLSKYSNEQYSAVKKLLEDV